MRFAGRVDILFGFVKILKHSARSRLQVIDGLKCILPSFARASRLLFFLVGVSDKLSWMSPGSRGFNLGMIRFIRARASAAHSWGWLQFLLRSCEQSLHRHWGPFVWGMSCPLFRIHADVVMRSATVATEWVSRRHFAVLVVKGRAAAFRWYQAGSWPRRSGERRMAARLVWYLRPAFNILIVSLFSSARRLPLVGGFQDWRKLLTSTRVEMPGGAAALSMRLVVLAHAGRDGEKFR